MLFYFECIYKKMTDLLQEAKSAPCKNILFTFEVTFKVDCFIEVVEE